MKIIQFIADQERGLKAPGWTEMSHRIIETNAAKIVPRILEILSRESSRFHCFEDLRPFICTIISISHLVKVDNYILEEWQVMREIN